jgi:hypothetical protein
VRLSCRADPFDSATSTGCAYEREDDIDVLARRLFDDGHAICSTSLLSDLLPKGKTIAIKTAMVIEHRDRSEPPQPVATVSFRRLLK